MTNGTEIFELWFKRPKPNPNASFRLFCFPFAGGGTMTYNSWPDDLPLSFELCVLQLPGRERRFKEKPFDQLLPLIKEMVEIVALQLDIPFAFFGHSLGALIGFELSRSLQEKKLPTPIHLFVSSWRAPHIIRSDLAMHQMPESKFIKELKRYNGTPELVLGDPELMDIFIPILRADFKIVETYIYENGDSIECPITAFGGRHDKIATRRDLEAWYEQTSKKFRLKMFHGGHFFIKNERQGLLTEIVKDLRDYF